MGFNPFKAAKKAVKKVVKSDIGKLALMYGAYQYGPLMFKGANPEALRGLAGWQKAAPAWLYSADASGRTASTGILADIGSKWRSMGPLGKAITVGVGTAAGAKALAEDEPDVPDIDDTTGHADYLRGRKGYLAEWAEWKAEQEGISYEEALADLEANPMFSASQGGRVGYNRGQFVQPGPGRQRYGGGARGQAAQNLAMEIAEDDYAQDFYDLDDDLQHKIYTKALQIIDEQGLAQGGRVKAQGGLFAGQMPGRNPGMNPMGMNQGLGAPNLGPRSMGMTPGMGQQPMDPRMAQMMQGQRGPTRAVPKESEDTELIQLIKMLTALGIPMEQLRGRTKEELVEMLVAVSGKGKGGTEIIEGEAIEERGGEEVEAAEEEVIQAAHGGRIGLAKGQNVPLQAGAQNYLGEQEMVTVPQHWKSGKDHPETELAYITKPELDLILKADFHGSLKDGPNKGPGGVMSLNDPATGRTGAEMSTMETTGRDPRTGKVTRESSGIRYGVINASRTGTTDGTTGTTDGNIISNFFNKQNAYNINKRNKHISDFIFANPRNKQMLIDKGIITEEQGDIDEMVLGHELPAWRWEGDIGSTGSLKQLQNLTGYTGGITTPGTGGGGGGQSYATAGGGTGTTTPTDGDDYYKFAEWDKWLMPGETTATPLMPGGYKKEILANTGGLMRTGYALGHPVIPSKDGPQLDMRDAGGYQPHGKAEKHDDVRALLAQGEFVMTSDAVKGMGGGDREMGAKKMYNLMHNMEAMA